MAQSTLAQLPGEDEKPRPCYLGALVPELLDLILFEMDSVRALANFVTTARFIYYRFDQRKRCILWRVMQNELGPVMVDARFLRLFPYAEPGKPRFWEAYWDQIHNDTALYRDMLAEGACAVDNKQPWNTVPSLAEMTQLCHTLHVINFFVSTYIAVKLRSFGPNGDLAAAPPSRTERQRVLRAFYRRQIVSNAWAPTRRDPNCIEEDIAAISNTSDHQGVRLGLFAAWEPWELQQIDHANKFITQLCVALYLAAAEQHATRLISEAEFGNIFAHADHLVRYTREHPSLAGPTLRALSSLLGQGSHELQDTAAPMININLFLRQYCILPLRFAWQSLCSRTCPDPAREKREADSSNGAGESGTLLGFRGDAVNLPPFGWVDALGGRYLNWFGEALYSRPRVISQPANDGNHLHYPVELWRSAGFTLWDRRRVEALKELTVLTVLQTGWAVNW
ncbi:hypothetical protein VMCG_09803 [Cytospora schulzeri]|uniref:Uncharacterized protein n=1 Tax=Cytospora schulzeri TaxID=448051 RepID=A0A423VHY3_9PEZI|nr:hypothetical protein VMCG_09803 [Valsa malicola]